MNMPDTASSEEEKQSKREKKAFDEDESNEQSQSSAAYVTGPQSSCTSEEEIMSKASWKAVVAANTTEPMPRRKTNEAQQKRKREKKRRDDMSEALNGLSELVFQIDPFLASGRSESLGKAGPVRDNTGIEREKTSVTTRTELIHYSTTLIKNLHDENQRKGEIIAKQAQTIASMKLVDADTSSKNVT
mmetsp:Transcript_22008/g.32509  ORF Transcript_22008/g.32509 Transcript_22008/m.32509 type:complete len:188 (-) Transcript_22008:232-795(-)